MTTAHRKMPDRGMSPGGKARRAEQAASRIRHPTHRAGLRLLAPSIRFPAVLLLAASLTWPVALPLAVLALPVAAIAGRRP